MTVEKALELISSGAVEFTKNNFSTCHSWHFVYEGVEYRLSEWEGLLVKVGRQGFLNETLDIFYLTPEAEQLYGHLHR
jgi:hypothetical protein